MNRHTFSAMVGGLALLAALVSGCRETEPEAQAQAQGTPPARVVVERVVSGLEEPVSLVPLSPTTWLVAERRSGRIRWIEQGKLRAAPFAVVQVPQPAGYHEYGLLSLAVDPQYPQRPYVYAFHTVGTGGKATGQQIVRFTVRNGTGVDPTVIVGGLPAGASCCHNGGRLLFGPDGMLYVTLGDTQHQELAQNYEALPGKVLRYAPDGSIPTDNPFELQKTRWIGTDGPGEPKDQLGGQKTPVYALGFRNPFALAVNPADDAIYVNDNGTDRNDELNRLVAGDNYGWPEVLGKADDPRFRVPLWTSDATQIAPAGMTFYTGESLPQFRNDLFLAGYNDGKLRRVVFSGPDNIATVTPVPEAGDNARLDVVMGRDGHLYFTSMNAMYRMRGERMGK